MIAVDIGTSRTYELIQMDFSAGDFEVGLNGEVSVWCRDNLSAMPEEEFMLGTSMITGRLVFANERDAAMFTLRWL